MDENRFAPPGAIVEDVWLGGGEVQPIKLWPPSGRLGRLRLLAYSVGLYLVFVLVTIVIGAVAGVARTNSVPLLLIETLVYIVFSTLLLIQRSHDMNFSGWWSLFSIIPLVGLVWLFVPGTPGANRWGAPPPPNTLGVKILALMLPLVFILGIVAAIALPAYMSYTQRAHAAAAR